MTFIFDFYFCIKGWRKKYTCLGDPYVKNSLHVYPPTTSRPTWYVTAWSAKSNAEFDSFWELRRYLKRLGVI